MASPLMARFRWRGTPGLPGLRGGARRLTLADVPDVQAVVRLERETRAVLVIFLGACRAAAALD